VRFENGKETIGLRKVFDSTSTLPPETVIENDYALPSVTATWNFRENMQARFGLSKTIGRPQFRELAEPTYYDVDSNRAYIGNSNLLDTEIDNFDARYEWYYGAGTYFTVGAFYKKLTNPVEQVFGRSENTYTYVNAPKADLSGFEIDFKGIYTAPWKGAFFENKNWVLLANYTNTSSEVKFGASDTVTYASIFNQNLPANLVFRQGTKLQGQSDHLANLQFGWDDEEAGSQATFLVTYVSERISARVSASEPELIQEPGTNVDFVYRKKITALSRPVNLSIEARNITGNEYKEFQQQGGDRIFIDRYKPGTSISVSLSTEF
jgi:outer membrane receptor protein involved in Fe transport